MPVKSKNRLRVVITGATSGLGRELAIQLARRQWRVAITGRRADELAITGRLARDAGGEVLILPGSVTEDSDVHAHYATIKSAWRGLDWAILNAGVGDSMNAKNFSAETYRWTFDTNVLGVCRWLEAVIPDMIAQQSGLIAGIASLAGYRGLPQSGPYCASKAALMTLLESTRVDLRGTGVFVSTVCPGFIKSEITARNNPGSMPFLMETDDGVRAILRGLDSRKRVVHFPWPLSYPMKYGLTHLPDFAYDWLAQKLSALRQKKPSSPVSRKT